jgi:hypothetical protein
LQSNSHLHIAKWLVEMKQNVSKHITYSAFQMACQNGHINTAQWLLIMLPDINPFAMKDFVFFNTCKNGRA